jgi:hypothetical protein
MHYTPSVFKAIFMPARWFESEKNRTIEQTVWRKNMLLNNEHYKLVNVNVENPILLPQIIRSLKF